MTGNYFDLLGVAPPRGRLLHSSDDIARNGHPIAVITDAFWKRHFGGDPSAVGSRVKLNGLDYTIVGIAPPQFSGAEVIYTPEIFVPMPMEPQIEPGNNDLDVRDNPNYFVVGR